MEKTAYAITTRSEMLQIIGEYRQSSTAVGLAYVLTDIAIYLGALAVVIYVDNIWLKLIASIIAGVKMAILGGVAHDAAHGNTTSSPKLNKFIAITCFTPPLFNYILWIQDHHVMHHPHTNGDHPDTYRPFSKSEYDALPLWRRLLERLFRTPFGLGIYYLFIRWPYAKIIPHSFMPKSIHAAAWVHFTWLLVYLGSFISLLAMAPLYSSTGSSTAILLGFALPLFVFHTMFSFTLYLQHTHPQIPWFKSDTGRIPGITQEDLTPHVIFPAWYRQMSHFSFEHMVHHVNPRIPFYRTWPAQQRLNQLLGDRLVITRFSILWFLKTMRTCRLYDFENHRWLNWDGMPLTDCILKPHLKTALQSARKASTSETDAIPSADYV